MAATAALGVAAASAPTSEPPIRWIEAPTLADLAAAFPKAALDAHSGGNAMLMCRVTATGSLDQCKIAREFPRNLGFGDAALALSSRYRADVSGPNPPQFAGIGIRFDARGPAPPSREVVFDRRKDGAPRLGPVGRYFPDLALRLEVGGKAQIDCRVDDKDRLQDCRFAAEDPSGIGFGYSAMKMAQDGYIKAAPAEAPPSADGYWRFSVVFEPHTLRDTL